MDTDEESNSAQNRKLSRQTTAGLRTTCLKLLATAYIYSKVPSNLELAGNAIELAQQLKSNDAGLFHLDLQKRLLEETAEEKNLIELCSKAIQASDLGDEATISVLASMIHSCSERCAKQHVLRCYQNLLSRLRGTNHVVWIERLLCAIGNVLTGPGDDDVPANESCHAFRQIYESLANTGLVISATTASSCQLMFWRSGDDSFAAGKIADALAFFTTSMEMRLDSFDMHNQQILNRRIADCHLKLGNPEAARKTITDSLDPALSKHPATLRLLFEADFLQNRVSDCVSDIEAIAAAPDSAAAASALGQVASFAADHSAGSDLVSIAIKNLIPIVKQDPLLARGRLLSLYRKLLDINKANMTEEAAARSNFPIFQEVLDLCQAPSATGDSDDQQHETEWLARNCWNAAVALESGNDMSMVARYLQIACALCNVASQGCKEEDRGDYLKRSVVGHTMTAAARLREAKAAVGADRKAEALEFALEEVERCKESLGTDSGTGELPGRELLLIEFECLLGLKRFNDLEKFLRNLPEDVHWSTLELMVDAAVKSDECPSGLQFLVIQSTLDAVLRQDEIDVSRLATWMRVLIITACNRNQSAALQFFSQVLEVLEDVEYPETEIEWLLIKAWNIGCDAMVAGDRRKAKTWSEIAMKCLPHLTSTKSKYESTMNETYAKIVAMEGEAQL
ncbi:hypothetical protein DFJ74DRAFT_756354 [Hyaloraphidium curvatum]|nr:hypothetical protein DFJ74DRAFT_756354 [Hyaloraphidium curvatum]